ncbi:MAG: 2-hydroxyglutaryl-CoA dehydratase [Polyangiaceae bacterium]|nr:2-hydroxyglutaryl-CoA dehydratase [Polyangiaceae bacterium]
MTIQFDTDKKRLPIAHGHDTLDVDAELARFEAEERERLGLGKTLHWTENMANLGFTKSQKGQITMLVGGLTMAHDYFVEGALSHLGYNVIALDAPNNNALRLGKEFGNRGQCNPTYFTVGNLIQYLIALRDKGMSTADIIDKFVFLTAGACGPCRFGMYATEYRKALRDAGFEGFRVMLFQQQGGLSQATGEESGLELKLPFFFALIRALVSGDVLNGLGYRIRPYEVVPGSTDAAMKEAKAVIYDALANGKNVLLALYRAKKLLARVKVDRLQPKPRVAIIGEFWAMTTEGDGNYALQRFLESEGGEVDIQFVTAWILYNIWEVRFDTKSRALLKGLDGGRLGLAEAGEYGVFVRRVGLWAADQAVRLIFQIFANAGGFYNYHLADMDEVAEVAAPYYDNDVRGGEGHMEVGKLILNVVKSKATMTLSVKPFGCMPSSSVSDGVQSLITERYPGTIFCAVETSGDGAVNFYSRVQMVLFKAKQAAQVELDRALASAGLTLDEVRAFIDAHPWYARTLYRADHSGASTAVDVVAAVAKVYGKSRWQLARERVEALANLAGRAGRRAVHHAPEALRAAAGVTREGLGELVELARERTRAANVAAAAG